MGYSKHYRCASCGFEEDLLLGFGFSYRKCTQELYAAIEQGAYGDGWRELFASSPLAGVSAEQTVFVCEGCGYWDVLEDPSIFEPDDPAEALEELRERAADPDWTWGHRPNTLLGLEYHLAHEYEAQCPCCGKKMRPLRMDEGTDPADPLVCPKCGAKNRFTYGLHFINWD